MEIFSLFGSIGIKGASEVKAKLQDTSKEADKTAKNFDKSTNDSSKSSSNFLSKLGSGFTGASNVVGKFVTGSGQKLTSFGKTMQSNGKAMKDFGNIAQPAFKLAALGIAAVGGAIVSGVKRFDTLNNAARSFENMGVSKGVITKEMNNLKAAIEGLPTPLDDAVSSTQMLTSTMNGDMPKSIEVYKALNDGILGFGGSAENVKTAVVQLSQGFANNKVGGQEWLSMMNNGLGPALNAMAKNMGMTTGELKDGLSEGRISVEEFQNQLIRLDKEGGGGMKSLSKIAGDSTRGIGTSFANLKTSITKFGAEILAGLGDRPQRAIELVRDKIGDLANKAKPATEQVVQVLDKIWPTVEKVVNSIKPLAPAILPVIGAFALFATTGSVMMKLGQTAQTAGLLMSQSFRMVNGVFKLTAGGWITILIALVAAITYFYNTNSDFKGFIDGLVQAIQPFVDAVVKGFQTAIQAIKDFFSWVKSGSTGAEVFKSILVGIGTPLAIFAAGLGVVIVAMKAWLAVQKVWQTITKIAIGIQTAFNAIMAVNPFVLLGIALAAIVGGLIYFFSQTKAGQEIWQGFISWLQTAWQGLSEFFSGLWTGIVNTFQTAIDGIAGFVLPIFNTIATGIEIAMNLIWSVIQIVWQLIKVTVEFVVGGIVAYVRFAIDTWVNIIQNAMNIIKAVFTVIWGFIGPYIMGVVNAIKDVITTVWSAISSVISSVMNVIKSIISTVWNSIKSVVSTVVNAIKAVITSVFNAVKAVVTSVWNAIKSTVTSVVNSIKSAVTTEFNAVKNAVTNIFNAVKSTITNIWNGIKSTISNTVNNIKSTVSNVFNNIKSAMTGPIETAKNIISGIVEKIKSFFNFKLSFPKIEIPKIPMPHFKISGEFNPLKGKIPNIGVDWYAKGGIMENATAFGMNGNNIMVGGEAGREAILPLNRETLGQIGDQIVASTSGMDGKGDVNVYQYLTSPDPLTPREYGRQTRLQFEEAARKYL